MKRKFIVLIFLCGMLYSQAQTVTLHPGPAEIPQTILTGATVVLPTPILTSECIAEGWIFAGWAEQQVVAETTTPPTQIQPAGNYTPGGNKILYAVYKKNVKTLIGREMEGFHVSISSYAQANQRFYSNPSGIWEWRGIKTWAGDYIQMTNTSTSYIRIPESDYAIRSIELVISNGSNGNYNNTITLSTADSGGATIATQSVSSAMRATINVSDNHYSGYIISGASCRVRSVVVNYENTVFLSNPACAELAETYYASAFGKKSFIKKTALHNIIKQHTIRQYDALWTDYGESDILPDGYIADFYSNCGYKYPDDQYKNVACSPNCECAWGYNREHSFPKSWFGGQDAVPMATDLVHVIPTDSYNNTLRSNNPYGTVSSPTYTTNNGGKLGPNTYSPTYTGTAFEPPDEYKGDLARIYFYMVTCYENLLPEWVANFGTSTEVGVVLNGTTDTSFADWYFEMLYQWHKQDPVSQREIDRNNAVYRIQFNRNPFVDYPDWVDTIWFAKEDTTTPPDDTIPDLNVRENINDSFLSFIFPNPVTDGVIHIKKSELPVNTTIPAQIELYNAVGACVKRIKISNPNDEIITINISDLPAATYILHLGNLSAKVVKQ